MTTVEVKLLGGFKVFVDGEAIAAPWRLRKARTLVKLLALAPDHKIHRDVLIDKLWPEVDLDAGANNLHQALHAARRILGIDRLVLRDEMVVLGPGGDVSVDIDRFLAAAASTDGTPASIAAALGQWSGDLLPEDLYEDWAAPHREQLANQRAHLVMRLAAAFMEQEDPGEAALILEPLAVERPDDEEVHRALVEALFASGRRSGAAAAFDRLRDALEEYGAVPSRAVTDMYRRLSTGSETERAIVANNLPASATSFVGRRRELRDLTSVLDRSRLLTITGPGGAGKTRLALELARRRAATGLHPDGVWLVDLSRITVEDQVASAVGTALDLQFPGRQAPASALITQLVGRHLLLVLDNCEHLLPAVGALVGELLARCPDLVLVTTSREPLSLTGETAWRTPSLNLPPPENVLSPGELARVESVQLFVNRASGVAPSFDLDEATAPLVSSICRELDGIPLALELAAARLAHLSLGQIERRLGDALGILASGGHTVDRQQTLAATLDWSYGLLTDEEKAMFGRLAVFAGGFDLDAASELSGIGDATSVLGRLVDKSLVAVDATGEVARYRLLEVVRQYAEARLHGAGELEHARRRHTSWFTAQAARNDPDRGVPVVLEPSAWFDVERDNLRAALMRTTVEDPCQALQLATSTWRFWLSRGQIPDSANWLARALENCSDLSALRARALFASGVLNVRRSQIVSLVQVGDDLADLEDVIGDDVRRAEAIFLRAAFSWIAHDWPRANLLTAEAMGASTVDSTVAVSANYLAGLLALSVGRLEVATKHFEAAVDALLRVPRDTAPFFCAMSICWITDDRGAVPIPIAEESLLLGRRVGAEQAHGYLDATTAIVHRLKGDDESALAHLDAASHRFVGLDDTYGLAFATNQRAHTLRWMGDLNAAIDCFELVEQYRTSLRDVRAVAMSVAGRVIIDAMLGRTDQARRHASEAIDGMRRTGDIPGTALMLHTAGLVEALSGDDAAALPLIAESIRIGRETLPIHALGWQWLLHAQLMTNIGDLDGAEASSAAASACFETLDDKLGIAALQRPRKATRITLHGG